MTNEENIKKASALLFLELDNFENLLLPFNTQDKITIYKAFDLAVACYSKSQSKSLKIFKDTCESINLLNVGEFMDIVMFASGKLNLIYSLDYHQTLPC